MAISYPYYEVGVRTHVDGSVIVRFTIDDEYGDGSTPEGLAQAIQDYLVSVTPSATNITKTFNWEAVTVTPL